MRDLISFFKYGGNDITVLGDQNNFIKRAYGMGVSQSGRFLRTFLYYGFNPDEKGRQVFDGVMAHVAGAGRGSFNIRFAQPSRDGTSVHEHVLSHRYFPVHRSKGDRSGNRHDRWLLFARDTGGRGAEDFLHQFRLRILGARRVADPHQHDGQKDAPIPDTPAFISWPASQHGPAAFPPTRRLTAESAQSE